MKMAMDDVAESGLFSFSETSCSDFSAAEASFFLKNSSLLLAFRLRAEGVVFFFFFWGDKAPSPLDSMEKEKLFPTFKEKEKDSDLLASIWQRSKHWDASAVSSHIAVIFTA